MLAVDGSKRIDANFNLKNESVKEFLCTEECDSLITHATLWTVAHQAPQSMQLPRQEYWSG